MYGVEMTDQHKSYNLAEMIQQARYIPTQGELCWGRADMLLLLLPLHFETLQELLPELDIHICGCQNVNIVII